GVGAALDPAQPASPPLTRDKPVHLSDPERHTSDADRGSRIPTFVPLVWLHGGLSPRGTPEWRSRLAVTASNRSMAGGPASPRRTGCQHGGRDRATLHLT